MTWWKATLFYGVKCGRVNTDEELFDVVIWEVTKMTVLYNNMVLGMTLKKHVASMPECVCGRCQQLNELVPSVTMHWMAFCFWGTPQHGNRPQTNTHTHTHAVNILATHQNSIYKKTESNIRNVDFSAVHVPSVLTFLFLMWFMCAVLLRTLHYFIITSHHSE